MTSLIYTLRRNIIYSVLSSAIRLSANAFLFILVAKYYGPVLFGQFTTAHTLAIIFTLFADFGFDLLSTTIIASKREEAYNIIPRMFGMKCVLSFIAVILMCSYTLIHGISEGARNFIFIFSLYLFFSALLNSLFAFFRGFDELHHETNITLTINLFLLVSLIILGGLHVDLEYIALSFVSSRVYGLIVAIYKISKRVPRIFPIIDLLWIKSIWKDVSVFGIYFIFGNLFFTVDTMLISLWRGDHEVGIYQSVFRIIALCLILPDITIAATLPSLARLYDNDRMQWIKLGSVLNRMLIHIGLFLGLFLIVGAESIINVLYGLKSYNAAVSLMKIFGIVVIIRYSVEIPALMLTTSRQQYKRMFLVVVATVVNVLLNMIAIPKYGIYGAAIVSLIVNALVGIGYIVTVKKSYYYQLFSLNNILPLCLTIMMFIVTILFPHYSFWYVSVVAFIIYASIVFNFGYKKEEKKILIQNSILAFKR